ncbi:MAG: alpha/beta hydrolase [Acidobacteriales bacterium]|nr:alpha/beta hydrolase [Terriglobales bacterium]
MSSEFILEQSPPEPDLSVRYGDDPEQFAELRLPAGKPPYPVVMNVHGGFWRARYNRVHAGHLCAALTALGFATWNVEYRRAGMPGGGWPGTLHDVLAAFASLQAASAEHKLDQERVLVMGHSAGGHLALCAAAYQPTITRVLSLAGVADLRGSYNEHLGQDAVVAFMGGTPAQVPELYRKADPMQLPIAKTTLQYLIHGGGDEHVPVSFSRDYARHKATQGESVNFMELTRVGHFELIDPQSSAWPTVAATITNLLEC